MSTSFTKMQGLGNDFVVINALSAPVKLNPKKIASLSNRRLGIGFDQVLIIEPSHDKEIDFHYRIYNADGTEAEQCGNGLRCIARYLYDRAWTAKKTLTLSCKGGVMEAEVEGSLIKVNMGPPFFAPKDIPCNMKTEQLIYTIPLDGAEVHMGILSMGNPHAIICVDDIANVDIAHVGRMISTHALFPKGVNVGFLQVTQPYQAQLQVYERGVGETLACGSGACAAMVYGNRLGILDREVSIMQPGGELVINWAGGSNPVYMTGPAEFVFEGQWPVK